MLPLVDILITGHEDTSPLISAPNWIISFCSLPLKDVICRLCFLFINVRDGCEQDEIPAASYSYHVSFSSILDKYFIYLHAYSSNKKIIVRIQVQFHLISDIQSNLVHHID